MSSVNCLLLNVTSSLWFFGFILELFSKGYLSNCQTNLVIVLHKLTLLFWPFINTTAYRLS